MLTSSWCQFSSVYISCTMFDSLMLLANLFCINATQLKILDAFFTRRHRFTNSVNYVPLAVLRSSYLRAHIISLIMRCLGN